MTSESFFNKCFIASFLLCLWNYSLFPYIKNCQLCPDRSPTKKKYLAFFSYDKSRCYQTRQSHAGQSQRPGHATLPHVSHGHAVHWVMWTSWNLKFSFSPSARLNHFCCPTYFICSSKKFINKTKTSNISLITSVCHLRQTRREDCVIGGHPCFPGPNKGRRLKFITVVLWKRLWDVLRCM